MVSIRLPPKHLWAVAFQKLLVIDKQVLISTYVQPGPGTKCSLFQGCSSVCSKAWSTRENISWAHIWPDPSLKHPTLVPGALSRVSLTYKSKHICTLAPSWFINCPPLAQEKFTKAAGGWTKHGHLCEVEEVGENKEKEQKYFWYEYEPVLVKACERAPKNLPSSQYSHGPACLQSLNQPWTTQHHLFTFHSTKDLEIHCTWGLSPHSTLRQSFLP